MKASGEILEFFSFKNSRWREESNVVDSDFHLFGNRTSNGINNKEELFICGRVFDLFDDAFPPGVFHDGN
jgi:hypothetical protein